MKIAVIGGGITGLTAAYILSKKNHRVTVYEKDGTVGGLARGFKKPGWEWNLEYAYHHLFTNDDAILSLMDDLGLQEKKMILRPLTATLFHEKSYPLDSASSLLMFPGLPILDRIRTGMLIAGMKINPWWKPLERSTAKEIFKKWGGSAGWKTIWEPLMVGKFGDYADSIAASWLWARIKKRTPSLIYIEGGFVTLIDQLVHEIEKNGGSIRTNQEIEKITRESDQTFKIACKGHKITEHFDQILLTTPTPLCIRFLPQLVVDLKDSTSIPHLFAQVLILETKEPILEKTYWLNITDRSFPFLAVVAHTNLIDKKHYAGHHITYIGNYLPQNHPYLKLTKDQLLQKFIPYLKKLNPTFSFSALKTQDSELFVGPFAQPVHQKNYSQLAPKIITSIPGLFVANMDSIYPWDRGTNYAVELGQKAAATILQ